MFFDDVGNFLKKNLVDPIDKAIVRPIDKAVIQPIREAADKDYALRHEHQRIEKIEASNAALRPLFYQAQQNLSVARERYERASEDFTKARGQPSFDRFIKGSPGQIPRVDPRAGTPELVKVIEDGGRFVLATVSLGLTEAIFNKDEIKRERAFLETRI